MESKSLQSKVGILISHVGRSDRKSRSGQIDRGPGPILGIFDSNFKNNIEKVYLIAIQRMNDPLNKNQSESDLDIAREVQERLDKKHN